MIFGWIAARDMFVNYKSCCQRTSNGKQWNLSHGYYMASGYILSSGQTQWLSFEETLKFEVICLEHSIWHVPYSSCLKQHFKAEKKSTSSCFCHFFLLRKKKLCWFTTVICQSYGNVLCKFFSSRLCNILFKGKIRVGRSRISHFYSLVCGCLLVRTDSMGRMVLLHSCFSKLHF